MGTWTSRLGTAVLTLTLLASARTNGAVVINELHTNPDVKTELVEFVELYHPGPSDDDLSGWSLSEGVFYTFEPGTLLRADGYIVVAQDLDHLFSKWSTLRLNLPGHAVVGPFAGKLSNDGERVVLSDASGRVGDEVTYKLGFPWPTVGDTVGLRGRGRSLQLVNPSFDNDLGGSWSSAYPTPAFPNTDVLAEQVPPYIRQVRHTPQQPTSGRPVTITAKITDADGLATVQLLYQVVDPGRYISMNDTRYRDEWTFVDMRDDGWEGDVTAATMSTRSNCPPRCRRTAGWSATRSLPSLRPACCGRRRMTTTRNRISAISSTTGFPPGAGPSVPAAVAQRVRSLPTRPPS